MRQLLSSDLAGTRVKVYSYDGELLWQNGIHALVKFDQSAFSKKSNGDTFPCVYELAEVQAIEPKIAVEFTFTEWMTIRSALYHSMNSPNRNKEWSDEVSAIRQKLIAHPKLKHD